MGKPINRQADYGECTWCGKRSKRRLYQEGKRLAAAGEGIFALEQWYCSRYCMASYHRADRQFQQDQAVREEIAERLLPSLAPAEPELHIERDEIRERLDEMIKNRKPALQKLSTQAPLAALAVEHPAMFAVTMHKGFHLRFKNGWNLSVQFGPGNYCQHHHALHDFYAPKRADNWESPDAEVAVWHERGREARELAEVETKLTDFVRLGCGDDVVGWLTPETVVALAVLVAGMDEDWTNEQAGEYLRPLLRKSEKGAG